MYLCLTLGSINFPFLSHICYGWSNAVRSNTLTFLFPKFHLGLLRSFLFGLCDMVEAIRILRNLDSKFSLLFCCVSNIFCHHVSCLLFFIGYSHVTWLKRSEYYWTWILDFLYYSVGDSNIFCHHVSCLLFFSGYSHVILY